MHCQDLFSGLAKIVELDMSNRSNLEKTAKIIIEFVLNEIESAGLW